MLRVAVRLIVIFVLAFAGVKIWYNHLEKTMIAGLPEEKKVAAAPVVKKVETGRRADDYSIITKRNIFGAALEKKAVEPEPEPVEELEPTKLKLSLMGTVYGNEKDSRAIISDDTKRKQDIYAVGDSIQGALIKAIERRRVILRVKGKDEVLDLQDREGGSAVSSVSAPVPHTPQRSLRDRLTIRRPTFSPTATAPNRPRPVVRPSRGPIVGPGEDEGPDDEIDNDIPDEDISDQNEDLPDEPVIEEDAQDEDELLNDETDLPEEEPVEEPER